MRPLFQSEPIKISRFSFGWKNFGCLINFSAESSCQEYFSHAMTFTCWVRPGMTIAVDWDVNNKLNKKIENIQHRLNCCEQ